VRAQGIGDLETARPLREDDAVRIGSITKTFVATLILQLADEGQLSLDDPLESYVPGVLNGERITIRHLLAMVRVANVLEDPAFLQAYGADLPMPFRLVQRWTWHSSMPPTSYQDRALATRNELLARPHCRTGDRHALRSGDRPAACKPLGLTAPACRPRQACLSRSAGPAHYRAGREDVTLANPAVTWTAGYPICAICTWTKALAMGTLLSPAMQAERLQWTAIPGGEPLDARYGLGILSLAGFLGHNGSIPGYSSIAMYLPEADATIVVLVNQSTLEGGPADFLFYQLGGLLFSERFASLQTRP
jgi:D-alanyl-D-alanine carboxypeptidase